MTIERYTNSPNVFAVYIYLKGKGYTSKNKVTAVEDDEYFKVKFELIVANSVFNEQWPEFANELVEEPVEIVDDYNKSDQLTEVEDVEDDVPSTSQPYRKIIAGIMKREPVTPLVDIKSSLIGKFVTVRGAVIRMAKCRPYVTHMTFKCKTCEASSSFEQPAGMISFPARCDECDSSGFMAEKESPTTRLITSRTIRIQDMNYSQMEPGSVPRSMECEIFSSMVGCCDVGDAVSISGIVKTIKDDVGAEKSLHKIYVEVVSLKNHKDSERTMGGHWFRFSNRDYYAIKEIHDSRNAFRLLVASICPSIYGHTTVKAALLLSLIGGTSRGDNIISRRSDINMLIVGDPGIGKSQMLKFISETAPKGLYVCGNGSTAAGLTVTLVRDGSDYSIEHVLSGQKNVSHATQTDAQGRERSLSGYVPLSEKLKICPGEEVDIIPELLLRNYITNKHRFCDSTPVTARQLEALIRLTEARAKAELREVATAVDAKDVLEIWESGLAGSLQDDVTSDLSHIGYSIPSTTAKANGTNAKKLLYRLCQLADRRSKNIFSSDEIKEAAAALGLDHVVEALVLILNNEG